MIDSFSCIAINGTELKLIESNFVVFSFESDAYLKHFFLHLSERLLYVDWDFTIVVIWKLLTFCTNFSYKSSSSEHQVGSLEVCFLWNNQKLLLKSKIKNDFFSFSSNSLEQTHCWFFHICLSFSENSLSIECLSIVRDE